MEIIPLVKPFYGMSKIGYLQCLSNKYGNFKVAIAELQPDGELKWSKHITMLEAWNVPWFLEKVNNRTGFECEIRLDLDPAKDETREQTDARFKEICDWFDNDGRKYRAFFTGSRSYHIHLIEPELAVYDEYDRKLFKKEILGRFGGELLKSSDATMMTLEFAPNNKTGKLKDLIRGDVECPVE